jgi:transposase InsO family protein
VIDCYSRRVVGWSMQPHMRRELVEAALAMAVDRRRPLRGVIHHFDPVHRRGVRRALHEGRDRGLDGVDRRLL